MGLWSPEIAAAISASSSCSLRLRFSTEGAFLCALVEQASAHLPKAATPLQPLPSPRRATRAFAERIPLALGCPHPPRDCLASPHTDEAPAASALDSWTRAPKPAHSHDWQSAESPLIGKAVRRHPLQETLIAHSVFHQKFQKLRVRIFRNHLQNNVHRHLNQMPRGRLGYSGIFVAQENEGYGHRDCRRHRQQSRSSRQAHLGRRTGLECLPMGLRNPQPFKRYLRHSAPKAMTALAMSGFHQLHQLPRNCLQSRRKPTCRNTGYSAAPIPLDNSALHSSASFSTSPK